MCCILRMHPNAPWVVRCSGLTSPLCNPKGGRGTVTVTHCPSLTSPPPTHPPHSTHAHLPLRQCHPERGYSARACVHTGKKCVTEWEYQAARNALEATIPALRPAAVGGAFNGITGICPPRPRPAPCTLHVAPPCRPVMHYYGVQAIQRKIWSGF